MYQDLVQPVRQAVLEMHHGIATLIEALETSPKGLQELLLQLASFPRPTSELLSINAFFSRSCKCQWRVQ